jgi:hypothetical protein
MGLGERLAFLRRINEGESDPDLLFGGGQHFDGVAVDDGYYAPADRFLLQASSVRGWLESILTENGKSTKENKQGNEFGRHATAPQSTLNGYLSVYL